MAGRRINVPHSVQRVNDETGLVQAVRDLQLVGKRVVVTANLVVGTNRIAHGLGRSCVGYTLTPTTANASFAHAINTTNPRPDLEVWITVIGVAQTAATIEVF